VTQTDPEVAEKAKSNFRLARAGVFLWDLSLRQEFPSDSGAAPKSALIDELRHALLKDPTVVSVESMAESEQFTYTKGYWPDTSRTSDDGLLTGGDSFSVLRLDGPILFCVQVPKKNQPEHHGHDDFPSDTYWVAWDGVSAIVTWIQPDERVPMAGGHVVEGILRSALRRLGCDLYVQACSPWCDNLFTHTVMHVLVDPEVDELECTVRTALEVDVTVGLADNDEELLMELWFGLNRSLESFAEMKNLGRRSVDLEDSARDTLSHLLKHYYEHATAGAQQGWKRMRALWSQRGWRREARQLMASLWLTLSSIESVHREWEEVHRSFISATESRGLVVLFDVDYREDAETVASLDVSHLEVNVQQIGTRLDNRSLAWATGLGAIAGGVAGLLAGFAH